MPRSPKGMTHVRREQVTTWRVGTGATKARSKRTENKTVGGSHCCAGACTMLAEWNRSGTWTIVKGKD